ncbi:MAG: MBL fold metallo-hydrolase [Alphaproteobacteria bacterium]|nr:MBL fold metallo-hydrolase [Alphaproteobacteria bacterium]
MPDLRVTVLGCGASGGVPLIGNNWGDCDPDEPRNRRRRSSILIEGQGGTTVLVDASPDCRAQLLDAGIDRLDAVIFTHAHADHVHGIDDLRWVNVAMGAVIPAWADNMTLEQINTRFGYVFAPLDAKARGVFYKPCLDPRPVGTGSFRIGGLDIQPFRQDHGFSTTLGLRIGALAYSVDVVALDDAAFERLAGVDTWIVGCLGRKPHPTHAHLDKVLGWIERVGPKQAWLSHMSHYLDYTALRRELPNHVAPAHDGLTIDI